MLELWGCAPPSPPSSLPPSSALQSQDVAKAALTDGCSVEGCTTTHNSLLCLGTGCHNRFCRRSENAHMLAYVCILAPPAPLSCIRYLIHAHTTSCPRIFPFVQYLRRISFVTPPPIPAPLRLSLSRSCMPTSAGCVMRFGVVGCGGGCTTHTSTRPHLLCTHPSVVNIHLLHLNPPYTCTHTLTCTHENTTH